MLCSCPATGGSRLNFMEPIEETPRASSLVPPGDVLIVEDDLIALDLEETIPRAELAVVLQNWRWR